MTDPNRFFTDHESLLIVARRILDDRAGAHPQAIAKGKLTGAAAAEREVCSTALVALWRHVVDRTPFDTTDPLASLGASWPRLRRDLDAALTSAQARAAAAPDDQVRRDIADCIASMRLHLTPVTPAGTPNIAFCHDFNLWRAASDQKKAA